MTDPDHLDKETAVSVSVTPTGIEAKAKSRLLSAVDRLGGNLFEIANSMLEAGISRRRATIEGERALIEATAKWGINQLATDDEFAGRTFGNHFKRIAAAQVNRDAVVTAAIEDLSHLPPIPLGDRETDTLSQPFLDRLDQYAAEASSEELRERWGRVLAAEVRQPGTFSNKVLRTVDELRAQTAEKFERVCKHRIAAALPKCLVAEIKYGELLVLADAGLVIEPGIGQMKPFQKRHTKQGADVWFLSFDEFAVSIPDTPDFQSRMIIQENGPITNGPKGPAMPLYMLTEAGHSISLILPDQTSAAFEAYCAELTRAMPGTPITKYRREGEIYSEFQ